MNETLRKGATNCAVDCGRVGRGNQVYILNQKGAVEDVVSSAIEIIVESRDAKAKVVWADPIPKGSDRLPPEVLDAYVDGDIVISHFPSLKRELLYQHVKPDTRSRVTNRALTGELLMSEWARFPYGLQLAIIRAIDTIISKGAEWRITSPAGTDVRGAIGASDSAVAQAYFARGDDDTRASRNFPGGVHTPLMSVGTEGLIVVDHANVRGGFRPSEPIHIELRDSRVTKISGGRDATAIIEELEKTDGYMDSWHAGTNPKTICPVTRDDDPAAWWTYAHCSPMVLHFHLGRTHAPVNIATFNQTVYVDGVKIYEDGRLAVLDSVDMNGFDSADTVLEQRTVDLS
jgi:hypothetical protein